MRKAILFFLGMSFLLFGCYQKELTCTEINAMIEKDQVIRRDKFVNPLYYLIDSLASGDTSRHDLFSSKAIEILKQGYHFVEKPGFKERLANMALIDSMHVETLLHFIEGKTPKQLEAYPCLANIQLLLAHSPNSFIDRIKKVVIEDHSFLGENGENYLITYYRLSQQ